MKYTVVDFILSPFTEEWGDILTAELSLYNFEGFEYTDSGIKAYVPFKDFKENLLHESEIINFLKENNQLEWKTEVLEERNWNKEWEDNFTPVTINNKIQIRAGFHPRNEAIPYDIIIEPKMSFGTGHHSTTGLMLSSILDFKDKIQHKRVLDMGCGTGILSIMAMKVGAKEVTGIDIDEWAYNNAMENILNNGFNESQIKIKIGDASLLEQEAKFDFILANINRNILLEDMDKYVKHLTAEGILLMSGFYEKDLPIIQEKAENLGLNYISHQVENDWIAVSFTPNKQYV